MPRPVSLCGLPAQRRGVRLAHALAALLFALVACTGCAARMTTASTPEDLKRALEAPDVSVLFLEQHMLGIPPILLPFKISSRRISIVVRPCTRPCRTSA